MYIHTYVYVYIYIYMAYCLLPTGPTAATYSPIVYDLAIILPPQYGWRTSEQACQWMQRLLSPLQGNGNCTRGA